MAVAASISGPEVAAKQAVQEDGQAKPPPRTLKTLSSFFCECLPLPSRAKWGRGGRVFLQRILRVPPALRGSESNCLSCPVASSPGPCWLEMPGGWGSPKGKDPPRPVLPPSPPEAGS